MKKYTLTSLFMISVFVLGILQLKAANRQEAQCWQTYIQAVQQSSGPLEGIELRLDQAWENYLSCSNLDD